MNLDDTMTRFHYFAIGDQGEVAYALVRFDTKRILTATYDRYNKFFAASTPDDFDILFPIAMGWSGEGYEVTRDDAAKVIAALVGHEIPIEEAAQIISDGEAQAEAATQSGTPTATP